MTRIASIKSHPISVPLNDVLWPAHEELTASSVKGKHASLPVWRLLGGENHPIPTYATGGYYRPGAPDTVYAEGLAGFVKAGYRAVKLKTGAESPEDEAKRVWP